MGTHAQPVQREENMDAFRGRSTERRGSNAIVGGSRKRKDRDSDGEEVIGTTGRKNKGLGTPYLNLLLCKKYHGRNNQQQVALDK